jgi:hypothetical protein
MLKEARVLHGLYSQWREGERQNPRIQCLTESSSVFNILYISSVCSLLSVSFIAVLSTAMSQDVAADASFLCDRTATLGAAINRTPRVNYSNVRRDTYTFVLSLVLVT